MRLTPVSGSGARARRCCYRFVIGVWRREDCPDRGHRRHRTRRGLGTLDAGHDVVVVTRSASGSERRQRLGARPVRGNVLDLDSLAAAYEGADAVVNLATKVPVGHGALLPGAWRRHDRLRTTGVANVVEAARRAGVRRVVQESVSFMYADQGDDWITEQSPVDITPMTEPAAVGESLVQDYSCDSRAGVVLRFGTIVGDDGQTRYWLRAARQRPGRRHRPSRPTGPT